MHIWIAALWAAVFFKSALSKENTVDSSTGKGVILFDCDRETSIDGLECAIFRLKGSPCAHKATFAVQSHHDFAPGRATQPYISCQEEFWALVYESSARFI